MSPLENTLINSARSYLELVLSYCAAHKAGEVSQDDENDYSRDRGAISALFDIAHNPESGLSPEAKAALLEIESKDQAALMDAFGFKGDPLEE
ncbi:hypothetical protein D3C77_522440 [compost metagenome]